jgi:hypothetical protein
MTLRFGCPLIGLTFPWFALLAADAEPDRRGDAKKAQAPVPILSPFGTEAFRYVLHDQKLKPLAGWNDAVEGDHPGRTVLVAFGDGPKIAQIDIPAFVKKGGALLLATDRELDLSVVQFLGARVDPRAVEVQDPDYRYEGRSVCPLVGEMNDDYALFRGIQKLATNRPGFLEDLSDPNDAEPRRGRMRLDAAAFFPACRLPGDGDRTLKMWKPVGPPFAMVHDGEKTRVVVLADHSVFINAMLLRTNNDNFAFAFQCVSWLVESGTGRRDQVLLVNEHGDIETHLDFTSPVRIPALPPSTLPIPPEQIPPPPIPPVEVLNEFLLNLERENVFNRMLLSIFTLNQIISAAILTATGLLLVYGALRLIRARHRAELHL